MSCIGQLQVYIYLIVLVDIASMKYSTYMFVFSKL